MKNTGSWNIRAKETLAFAILGMFLFTLIFSVSSEPSVTAPSPSGALIFNAGGNDAASAGFDFALLNSGNVTVVQGDSGSNNILATLTSGTSQPITLSVTGLPAGASPSFTGSCTGTPTCTASPPFLATLTINTSLSTPPGSFLIVVEGTGGGQAHTTQFTLRVIAASTVGGVTLPVDKLALLAPYVGLASILVGAAALTVMYVKRLTRKNE